MTDGFDIGITDQGFIKIDVSKDDDSIAFGLEPYDVHVLVRELQSAKDRAVNIRNEP